MVEVTDAWKMSEEDDTEHIYFSTWCLHKKHDKCKRSCKSCASPCTCVCHVDEQVIKVQ